MNKKVIGKCINNLVKELQHNYVIILQDFDERAIHRFRVNYKKIRALFELHLIDKYDHFKFNIDVKHTYKLLGHIRDLQLLYTYLTCNSNQSSANLYWFISRINRKCQLFKYLVLANVCPQLNFKYNDDLSDKLKYKISKKMINHHIQSSLEKITKIVLLDKFDDAVLHDLRKKIKHLNYLFTFDFMKDFQLLAFSKFSFEELSSISIKLGEYQDLTFEIKALDSTQLCKIPIHEFNLLQNLREDWMLKKNELKKRLILELKQLLISVI